MVDEDIELGYEVQDRISGFHGIVTTIGDHVSGCTRFGVQALGDEKSSVRGDEEFFYADQLDVLDDDTAFVGAGSYDARGIKPGARVRDEIQMFEGVAEVVNYKLWNCPQVLIKSADSSNPTEESDSAWADITRVETVDGTDFVDEYDDIQLSDDPTDSGAGPDSRNRTDTRY